MPFATFGDGVTIHYRPDPVGDPPMERPAYDGIVHPEGTIKTPDGLGGVNGWDVESGGAYRKVASEFTRVHIPGPPMRYEVRDGSTVMERGTWTAVG